MASEKKNQRSFERTEIPYYEKIIIDISLNAAVIAARQHKAFFLP